MGDPGGRWAPRERTRESQERVSLHLRRGREAGLSPRATPRSRPRVGWEALHSTAPRALRSVTSQSVWRPRPGDVVPGTQVPEVCGSVRFLMPGSM